MKEEYTRLEIMQGIRDYFSCRQRISDLLLEKYVLFFQCYEKVLNPLKDKGKPSVSDSIKELEENGKVEIVWDRMPEIYKVIIETRDAKPVRVLGYILYGEIFNSNKIIKEEDTVRNIILEIPSEQWRNEQIVEAVIEEFIRYEVQWRCRFLPKPKFQKITKEEVMDYFNLCLKYVRNTLRQDCGEYIHNKLLDLDMGELYLSGMHCFKKSGLWDDFITVEGYKGALERSMEDDMVPMDDIFKSYPYLSYFCKNSTDVLDWFSYQLSLAMVRTIMAFFPEMKKYRADNFISKL